MRVISWNILSNLASKFNLAGKRVETEKEWKDRYSYVIFQIVEQLKEEPDIICLQEVTEDFIKQLTESLKALNKKNKLPYRLAYPKLTYQQACLIHTNYKAHLLKYDFSGLHPWSKTFCLKLTGPRDLILINLHLNGDPDQEGNDERRSLIRVILNHLKFENFEMPIIMVGDFNEEAETLYEDLQDNFLEHQLELYRKNDKITSYHAYEFHYDKKQKKLILDGLSDRKEQKLDQIVYSSELILKQQRVRPKNGLKGLQVPYTHKVVKKDIINESNYKTWPSDHAMMIYDFL